MRSRRTALWVVTAATFVVGAWALLAPGAFSRDFPLGRAWVAVDGPFNEHLVRDVGGLYLALTVVTASAAWRGEPAVVRLAAVATLVFAVPHAAYHATHLAPFGAVDAAANVLTLTAVVLMAVWLAWSPAPRPGAPLHARHPRWPTSGDTQVFDANRRRLFGIAYRMLGEVGEAEDAVQEAFARWMRRSEPVDNADAWLTTVVSRICLDRLKSAQRTRETYVGPWLPEPLATDAVDPADSAALADSLSLAFLVVLERLSPLERRLPAPRVFGYSHDEIAAMVDRSPAAVRKIASRARGHLAEQRPRYEPDADRRDAVTQAFMAAVAGADLGGLMDLLAPEVTFVADGGGVVPAVRHPLHGADRVARAVAALARRRPAGWSFAVGEFNREPGIKVLRTDGTLDSLWILHVADDRVAGISVIRSPGKLRRISGQALRP